MGEGVYAGSRWGWTWRRCEVYWEEVEGPWKLVIGKKCTRASEDSERALRLDPTFMGYMYHRMFSSVQSLSRV